MRRLCAVAAASMVVVAASTSCSSSTGPDSPTQSKAEATSLSLPARWWLWTEASPVELNPIDDPTGASCALNQPDDVWFLAGTHGGSATRSCEIPAGRPIYFPVINQICEVAAGRTAQDALRDCAGSVDASRVTLDGRLLTSAVATSTTSFTFTARTGSTTGLTAGDHDAVAWGLWSGPVALTPGEHLLSFAGRSGTFRTAVVYKLSVVDGKSGSDQ